MLDCWIRPINDRRSLVIASTAPEELAGLARGADLGLRRQVARRHPLGQLGGFTDRMRDRPGHHPGDDEDRQARDRHEHGDRLPLLAEQLERLARVLLDRDPPAERGKVGPGRDHRLARMVEHLAIAPVPGDGALHVLALRRAKPEPVLERRRRVSPRWRDVGDLVPFAHRDRGVAGLAQAEIGVERLEDRRPVEFQRDDPDRRPVLEHRTDDEGRRRGTARVDLHVRHDRLDQRPRATERPGQFRPFQRPRVQARADLEARLVRDQQRPVGVEKIEIHIRIGLGEGGQPGPEQFGFAAVILGLPLAVLEELIEPVRGVDDPRRVEQETSIRLAFGDELLQLRRLGVADHHQPLANGRLQRLPRVVGGDRQQEDARHQRDQEEPARQAGRDAVPVGQERAEVHR